MLRTEMLLFVLLLLCRTAILCNLGKGGFGPRILLKGLGVWYAFGLLACAYLCFLYVLDVAQDGNGQRGIKCWILAIPALIDSAVLLSNPWTKAVYFINMVNYYKKGPAAYLIPAVGMLYLVVAFLLVFTGIYFVAYNLSAGYPYFSYSLAGSLIVFIVGIPLITMRSFSEERKNKTDQLLLTAPVSLWKVVLGKYLAMITVIGIPSVIFCIYPLIIKSQGTAYLGVDYISILVFFLLGCVFAAIGMFLSSLTESQIIAFISTFGILLVLYLWNGILTLLPSSAVSGLVGVLVILTIVAFYIFHMTSNLMLAGGLEVIGAAAAVITYFVKSSLFENLLSKMFGRLALSDVFTDITSNSIVDVTGIALYLSLIAVFVFLTVQSIQKRRWS